MNKKQSMRKSKKGDVMLDILSIILALVLFFLFATPIDTLAKDVVSTTDDTTIVFLIRGFVFFLLIGIIRYVLRLSDTGGTEQ